MGGGMERFGEEEIERVNMADVLQLLLPRPGNGVHGHGIRRDERGRIFKCKTCNRRFSTFQALGGHSTSHRKQKPPGGGVNYAKPKVHGCAICGLEFAMGQALGGHMRRHKAELEASAQQRCGEKASPLAAGGMVCLDLNMPPMEEEDREVEEDDMELLTLGLGVRLAEKVPVVGCMGYSAITY